jgi:hypothetical protein
MALKDDVLQYFPAYAWALDIPDVAAVLQKAVSEKWSSQTLIANLQQTNWWKNTQPSLRQYNEEVSTDPERYAEEVRRLSAKTWDLSNQLGLGLQNTKVADDIARQALQLNWNDEQIRDALVTATRQQGAQGQANTGLINTTIAQLKQNASSYMVNIDDKTAFDWATSVAANEHKVEDYNEIFKGWAKGQFAPLAPLIDQGVTPEQYFSPMKQAVAQTLEISPDEVDMIANPKYSKIAHFADPKTGAPRPMTISEAQTYARGLDEWKSTRQGQQAAADMGSEILKTFGKIG